MKLLIILCCLTSLVLSTVVTENEWAEYKSRYGKTYSGYENTRRRSNYLSNKIYINLHNSRESAGLVSYRLALNQFSDMSRVEFFQMLGGIDYSKPKEVNPTLNQKSGTANLPKLDYLNDRNWTQDGGGYEILNQGACNAAWAFATLSAIETHHFQVYAQLPPKLSVQNLIDCAGGVNACNGLQNPKSAYEYIMFHMNINADADYPYKGKQSFCKYNPNKVGGTIGGFETLAENDDNALLKLVSFETAVVVGFNPFSFEFMHYSSGIFVPPTNPIKVIDKYYMAVIGYGTNGSNKDYWILKNAMGTSWGELGYMRMIRNNNYPLAKHASFANV